MPYQSTKALPKPVRDKYGPQGERAFKSAFNSAHKAGNSEQSCFRIAHSAAKQAERKKG